MGAVSGEFHSVGDLVEGGLICSATKASTLARWPTSRPTAAPPYSSHRPRRLVHACQRACRRSSPSGATASARRLDNCEHVIGQAAPLVDTLLAAVPGLRLIATSREPLSVPRRSPAAGRRSGPGRPPSSCSSTALGRACRTPGRAAASRATELELGHCLRTPPKARAPATSCSPARSSLPPPNTRPDCPRGWPSSSNSSTTPLPAAGNARSKCALRHDCGLNGRSMTFDTEEISGDSLGLLVGHLSSTAPIQSADEPSGLATNVANVRARLHSSG